MATAAMIAIESVVTSGNQTNVEFTGLSGYRDYVIMFDTLKTNSGENVYMEINGDTTTANYALHAYWGGPNTSQGAVLRTDAASIIIGYNTGPSSTNAMQGVIQFMDAGATDKHKVVYARTNNVTDNRVGAATTRWANNNAITSIKLKAETTYFLDGANITIYGILGEV